MRNKKLAIYLILGISFLLTILVVRDIINTKKLPVTAKYYGNFNDVKGTYKLRDKNKKYSIEVEELKLRDVFEDKDPIVIVDLDSIKSNENAIDYIKELLNNHIPIYFYYKDITKGDIAKILNINDVSFYNEDYSFKRYCIKITKLTEAMGNGSEYLLQSHYDLSGMSKKERIKSLLDIEVKGLNKY